MSFETWLKEGRLKRLPPARQEIASLLRLAGARLADSRVAGVSVEGRFLCAYNAALTFATAALRASGYRTATNLPGHHAVTIASLSFTVGIDPPVLAALDAWRRKRNSATYEGAETVSEHELRELIRLVEDLDGALAAWLRRRHPTLAP